MKYTTNQFKYTSSLYVYLYTYPVVNRGRAAKTKLNSILWDRDVTLKTKTHIYHALVKSTITYAAETWCLKAKNGSKTEFHRNGLLATLGSNFQEGQN